ncbi:MAG TPA: tetratricopeptide repeat protein, partial [Vicinamibacterales bacterium]|nr:tetratricopeptide repeat protein [Vicinamibacterales bacterium]
MNRDETLRRAEKLLRQGRVEAAIPEYARLVEASPRDWNTANLLGDLYVRAGRIDEAVGHYARIAEHLASEGFVSKATALYKKIVKIRPDDDAALLRTAELSASQGLTAEARVHLRALFAQRARRGDRAGASRAATALADLDPRDAAARAEIARMMADLGDAADAAAHLRAAGHAWLAAGQADLAAKAWREGLSLDPANEALAGDLLETLLAQGDLDGARDVAKTAGHWRAVADGFTNAGRTGDACAALERVLASEPADVPARIQLARAAIAEQDAARARALLAPVADNRDPAVLLGLAEIEFLSGSVEVGRAALERLLAASPELVQAAVEVGCDIGRTAPDKGFAVIGVAVKDAEAAGDTDAALEMIERFLAAAPGCIQALEDYIRLCGQGFYEHQRYRAQVQLADAYLSVGRWREARALAEALASARPDDSTHQRRLALASAGLGAAAGGEILPQSAPSPAE